MTRRRLALAAAALTALAVAGCSAKPASHPAPYPDGAAPAAATANSAVPASVLASLRAKVTQAEKAPAWTAPGPPASAAAVKGKTLMVMPVNSAIDACATQAKDFQALGQQLGANVVSYATTGAPPQWSAGLQQALARHYSAVAMLCGVIPAAVSAQLAQARAAGVPVVDGNYNETSDYAGLSGETAVNTAQGITNDVDYAITQLDGRPLHALLLTSDSIIQGPAATQAAVSAVHAACPKACTIDQTLNIPIQSWPTDTQNDVTGALTHHPDVNAVIVVFDGMVQFAYQAIAHANHPALGIYTWGGSLSVEKLMAQKGSLIAADPGPDEQWDAYESMDQVIRLLGGHPSAPVSAEVAPDRFWVPSNVGAFFSGGTYGNEGYGGSAFISGFRHLWGLPS